MNLATKDTLAFVGFGVAIVLALSLVQGCNIEVDLSCDIEPVGNGCFHATCEDGTSLTLCNGQDGESCELLEYGEGECLLSCPDTEGVISNCEVLP